MGRDLLKDYLTHRVYVIIKPLFRYNDLSLSYVHPMWANEDSRFRSIDDAGVASIQMATLILFFYYEHQRVSREKLLGSSYQMGDGSARRAVGEKLAFQI